jgi:hypothetical protein
MPAIHRWNHPETNDSTSLGDRGTCSPRNRVQPRGEAISTETSEYNVPGLFTLKPVDEIRNARPMAEIQSLRQQEATT